MFVLSGNDLGTEFEVGSKAERLRELAADGFNVPVFVVVPVSVVVELVKTVEDKLSDRNHLLENLQTEIVEKLPVELYAVRSAALVEDGKVSSSAGQFKTILKVTKEKLSEAILSVAFDAKEKLGNDLKFSIIVQEYVKPDFAGVIFSRDPAGGREMVLEYNEGVGESVVGGETVSSLKFLFGRENHLVKAPEYIIELAQSARRIEDKYSWPQDIEWAVKKGVVYILQTRPVTSITENQWQGIKYLDNLELDMEEYFFEQTSVSETFHKPKPLAFSIAKALYATGGPVEKTYKHFNVKYEALDQLRLFGNRLYVNRQAELKSILPTFGYLKHRSNVARVEEMSKGIITIRNWLHLFRVSNKFQPALKTRVDELLEKNFDELADLKERWLLVLEQYEVVFEVNIRAQKAFQLLTNLLGPDSHFVSQILDNPYGGVVSITGQKLIGNSFNIDDVSEFVSGFKDGTIDAGSSQVDQWLESIPAWRRLGIMSYVEQAQKFNVLREQARILSVKLISYLRNSVGELGEELFADEKELIYFSTIEELMSETASKDKCLERQQKYLAQADMDLPKTIASFVVKSKVQDNLGVSSGIGRGVLVTKEMIDEVKGDKILYTKILSPDLVKYFSQINGIVSEQGGLLSHLAIMAREQKLPVVVTSQIPPIMSERQINGSTGEITK